MLSCLSVAHQPCVADPQKSNIGDHVVIVFGLATVVDFLVGANVAH